MAWSLADIEMLRRLWAENKSQSEIAKAIGNKTASAIAGKISRLGLTRSVQGAAPLQYVGVKTPVPDDPAERCYLRRNGVPGSTLKRRYWTAPGDLKNAAVFMQANAVRRLAYGRSLLSKWFAVVSLPLGTAALESPPAVKGEAA